MAKKKEKGAKKQIIDGYEYVRSTEKVKLFGLSSHDYEHPLDRRALDALERTPGLTRAISKLIGETFERSTRLELTASAIKVTPNNFPKLYAAYIETCDILDMPVRPPLYIATSMGGYDGMNAFAAGSENPMIAFTKEMVKDLSDDELRYVIGHELGHIKSNHGLYRTLAALYINIMTQFVKGVLPTLIGQGLGLALMKWSRMAEFTCDRAGLLACQNPEAAIRANMKLAGLPLRLEEQDVVDSFIEQAREFEDFDFDMWDRIVKDLAVLNRSHPWTVIRAKEILMYVESGEYQRIIDTCKERLNTPISRDASFCPYCGTSMDKELAFCTMCGAEVDTAV